MGGPSRLAPRESGGIPLIDSLVFTMKCHRSVGCRTLSGASCGSYGIIKRTLRSGDDIDATDGPSQLPCRVDDCTHVSRRGRGEREKIESESWSISDACDEAASSSSRPATVAFLLASPPVMSASRAPTLRSTIDPSGLRDFWRG